MLKRIEHDAILELNLDRPPANALNQALLTELADAIDGAADEGHGAVFLSGRAGIFSGGLDVPELLGLDRDGIDGLWRSLFKVMNAIARSNVPVAAAITGHSPAGGAVLTLFCDYRVMAEGSFRIGLNEVQVGLTLTEAIYGPLARLVGVRQAERLAVSGALVQADEALRLGWVDEVAPVEEVVPRALQAMSGLLALPRKAMLDTRSLMRADLVAFLDDNSVEESELTDRWFSDETQAAMRALVARLAEKAAAR